LSALDSLKAFQPYFLFTSLSFKYSNPDGNISVTQVAVPSIFPSLYTLIEYFTTSFSTTVGMLDSTS
jgi:hypothetical protein